nr:hypothetical protein [Archangium sp. Cb G35]
MLLLAGCATGLNGLGIPDGEAIYDVPLEELWPSVRQFFTDNELPFREDKGNFVLETEWREEFGGSKVAGFWHRYLVLGKRETPTRGKLWIIRDTRSANGTLAPAGDQEALQSRPIAENAIVAGSAQGVRDLVMEWKVFHALAPRLARKAPDGKETEAAKAEAPEVKAAPVLAVECGLPIVGLPPEVKRGGVMLLGELHGTREVPRFVAQAACQTASNGIPVTVGLELPVEHQQLVATFLRGAGSEGDWLKLMEAPFWRNPHQDGRGSEAMANLLEQLRQLRARGLDVDAFVFDHPGLKGQEHEDARAATVLSRVRQTPGRFFLVLTGNIHARATIGVPWNNIYRPMGVLLSGKVELLSLDMAYNSGSAWICAVEGGAQVECGVRPARGKDNGNRFFVHRFEQRNKAGYHGFFYVGPVTASLPAVHRGLGRPGSRDDSHHPSVEPGDMR